MSALIDKPLNFNAYDEIGSSEGNVAHWIPLNRRDHLSIIHILGICGSMLAFQIAYSVEFALGTPIMNRLGVPQVASSLIWLCGPLSGFIVQPLIGFYSDITSAKMGRRRPFILVGTIGIVIGFAMLFFVETIGEAIGGGNSKSAKIAFFVVAFLLTNVSINVLQGPSRALIGDVVPQHQQVLANTLASWMLGLAAVITNMIGGLSLAQKININGINDERLVFIVGTVLLIIGVLITMLVAKEEILRNPPKRENPFKEIFSAVKNIPKPVLRISIVYFFSWMAYFPFNIETTDFFGNDIYKGTSYEGEDHQKYIDGQNFGMLVIAVSNCLVLVYSFIQGKVVDLLGMKWAYAISQIIEACCLVPVFFVTNKWWLMALLAPLGISCTIFNSVPFAVVGMIIPQDQMGIYMGVLNSFAVVGQQAANFLIGSGVGAISKDWKAPIIGSGSVFAVAAAIMCAWIIVPKNEMETMSNLVISEENTPILN